MAQLAELLKEFPALLHPNVLTGLGVTVVLFILELRWTRAHPPRNRRAEKAAALGHVATALREKYWDDGVTPGESATSWYHADYRYEAGGKQYRYRYLARAVPPVRLRLYHLSDPARAFTGEEKPNAFVRALLLFPMAAGAAVLCLLGIPA